MVASHDPTFPRKTLFGVACRPYEAVVCDCLSDVRVASRRGAVQDRNHRRFPRPFGHGGTHSECHYYGTTGRKRHFIRDLCPYGRVWALLHSRCAPGAILGISATTRLPFVRHGWIVCHHNADFHLSDDPFFRLSIRINHNLSDPGGRYITGFYLLDRNVTTREVAYFPTGCTCPPDRAELEPADFASLSKDQYEIRGVRPGSYDLIAVMLVGDVKPGQFEVVEISKIRELPYRATYEGRSSLVVVDSDVNATIEIRHGVDVEGRMISTGKPAPIKNAGVYLTDKTGRLLRTTQTDKDGKFVFRNMPVASYSLSFSLLPGPDSFAVDARQNGVSILDSEITVGDSSVEPIEVLVGAGGTLDGVVRYSNQVPLIVVLFPEATEQRVRLTKLGRTDPSGNFKLRGIAPGSYRVFAIDQAVLQGNSDGVFSEAFLSRYLPHGLLVTVRSSETVTVSLLKLGNK